MIIALLTAEAAESAFAFGHQDCPCCNNACSSASKCHDNVPVCICIYQLVQSSLTKTDLLPELIFAGYFRQKPRFAYLYQANDDIFHPPKA
jgi:hypothetical protein